MPSRAANIAALLTRSEADLTKIEGEYNSSLHAQTIAPSLKIDIKNLCGNLRSVLDYLAHDIRERHCPSVKSADKFYFPILPDATQFASQVERGFPGLKATAPALWHALEAIQPYHAANAWLALFNRVNNENKHGDLVEQSRVETREVRATSAGGGMVSWNPGAVTFGSGVFINGVPVNPQTQMPVPHPSRKVERFTWVDFRFAGIDVSALQLLKQSVAGTRNISDSLAPLV